MAHMTPWYTGDATANTFQPDFSPLVLAPPLPGADIALWPIIGKLVDGIEPSKFEWIEEPLTAISVAIAETLTTTDTAITCAASALQAAGVRVGTLLRNGTDKTKKEVMKVTVVDSSTQITVVRDFGGFVSGSGGGTTGETHTSGDVLEIINNSVYEGSAVSSSVYKATRNRSPKYNYYTLLDDQMQITASDLVRQYRGSSPDNWGFQMNGLRQRLDRMYERTLIHSPQVARAADQEGSMGGLLWYATQTTGASGYSYVTTSEAFSYEVWDDGMKYLYDKGTLDNPNDIVTVVPSAGLQYASYIHESAMRGEYANELVRGQQCTSLMSTLTGQRVPLIASSVIPTNSFMILNLNALRIHFLEGRALTVYNQEVGENMNDYRAARPISELTLEFHKPVENCYYHTGVSYTRP